jgi:very-short-patch-repair endonuclease
LEKSNNIPSLASVMTSAAREVVNKTNNKNSGGGHRNYAQIRTAQMGRAVSINATRAAQMYGGGSINNTQTQPNFYSPFLTPSSFQVPNTRKEVYLWANWWRTNDPKVAAGINFYRNFPFNGWKLECKSAVVKDYFEKLIQKLNFQKWLPEISNSYHTYGDAFVFTSIDCPICKGSMVDPKTGEECGHKGATWKSISLLNPDSVEVSAGFMDAEPMYSYLPSPQQIKVVMDRQPRKLFDAIPDDVKVMIAKQTPIPLNPACIHHFKHAADAWADYGTSIVRPLFVTLAYKDKLRQAQWLIAERLIIPIKIVTVGDENRPASQEDLDSVQDQLSAVANDPNLTLVTPHAFKLEFVGASSQILQTSNEHELLDQEALDGLMLNKSLLNGEGPNYGNAQVGLMSMNERLETWRREVAQWVEEKLFKQVAEWNEFYTTGEGGQKELIYPTIKFDNLKLKDNTGVLQTMVTAQQNGAISAQTLVEAMDLDWDQEVERLRFEQGMNFVNSTDIMDTDMNIGFGGVSGQGFGIGAVNQPLTGGPDIGGMPGAPMPDAGAPGAGGAMPPAAPAPTAKNLYKQYRFAAEIMNEIYFNRNTAAKMDTREFLNDIDRELNERFAVNGRGWCGEIPETLGEATPWEYTPIGEPLGYLAEKEVRTSAVQRKNIMHGYTGLEKKLYKLVMSMNVPLAFYAQYEAGPSKNYTLDGAFPAIKLAVEADGEIWHNNPNKIAQDKQRDMSLAQQGWTILRFTDKEIEKQPQEVAMVIKQALQKLLGAHTGGGVV